MSKSKGNALSPQDVVDSQGADILRLWVVASNYEEDLRFGPEILKHQSDAYRRLRNTLRYLLGNLDGFDERERVRSEEHTSELQSRMRTSYAVLCLQNKNKILTHTGII